VVIDIVLYMSSPQAMLQYEDITMYLPLSTDNYGIVNYILVQSWLLLGTQSFVPPVLSKLSDWSVPGRLEIMSVENGKYMALWYLHITRPS
jgi:hypothetical protein